MSRLGRSAAVVTSVAALGTTVFTTACQPPPPPTSCDWLSSAGARGPSLRISTDTTVTHFDQVSSGDGFGNGNLARHGYIDFDGDNLSDVVRTTVQAPDGAWYLQYKSGGRGNWITLSRGPQLQYLRFGDFNNDGKTDVFSAADLGNGTSQWLVSYGGTTNFANLARGPGLDRLRLGDFNGDGYTDVMSATGPRSDGLYQWVISYYGTQNFVNVAAGQDLPYLRFGDFNGDGHTDVFSVTPKDGINAQWQYVPSANGLAVNLRRGDPVGFLRFADTNADGVTDVLEDGAEYSDNMSVYWLISYGGTSAFDTGYHGDVLWSVQLGDFDWDKQIDVLTVKCS